LKKFVTLVLTSIYDLGCGTAEGSADASCDEDPPVHKLRLDEMEIETEKQKQKMKWLENNLSANQTLSCHWYMFAAKREKYIELQIASLKTCLNYSANFHSKS
jgi:hypothetical protein